MSSFRINIFTLRQCELFKLIVKSTCTKRRFITATGVSQPPHSLILPIAMSASAAK